LSFHFHYFFIALIPLAIYYFFSSFLSIFIIHSFIFIIPLLCLIYSIISALPIFSIFRLSLFFHYFLLFIVFPPAFSAHSYIMSFHIRPVFPRLFSLSILSFVSFEFAFLVVCHYFRLSGLHIHYISSYFTIFTICFPLFFIHFSSVFIYISLYFFRLPSYFIFSFLPFFLLHFLPLFLHYLRLPSGYSRHPLPFHIFISFTYYSFISVFISPYIFVKFMSFFYLSYSCLSFIAFFFFILSVSYSVCRCWGFRLSFLLRSSWLLAAARLLATPYARAAFASPLLKARLRLSLALLAWSSGCYRPAINIAARQACLSSRPGWFSSFVRFPSLQKVIRSSPPFSCPHILLFFISLLFQVSSFSYFHHYHYIITYSFHSYSSHIIFSSSSLHYFPLSSLPVILFVFLSLFQFAISFHISSRHFSSSLRLILHSITPFDARHYIRPYLHIIRLSLLSLLFLSCLKSVSLCYCQQAPSFSFPPQPAFFSRYVFSFSGMAGIRTVASSYWLFSFFPCLAVILLAKFAG